MVKNELTLGMNIGTLESIYIWITACPYPAIVSHDLSQPWPQQMAKMEELGLEIILNKWMAQDFHHATPNDVQVKT